LTKLEQELGKHKAQVSDARGELRRRLEEAERSLPREEHMRNAERYERFPLVAEQLEADIRVMSEQCARMTNGGYGVLQEFERQRKLIDRLQTEVDGEERNAAARRKRFETGKRDFLEWLNRCIDGMRKRFSRLYAQMGCRGDIQLVNADSDRIVDLEIQILASYREDKELRPISAASNSGGEKMACTMLYCFALQDEEKSPPFVIVDELNQVSLPERLQSCHTIARHHLALPVIASKARHLLTTRLASTTGLNAVSCFASLILLFRALTRTASATSCR
jgi:chromosome segregation ATPase